jgi:hypothetical protein
MPRSISAVAKAGGGLRDPDCQPPPWAQISVGRGEVRTAGR